ncbi:MAG: histidine kinase dimerization/phospho-acceptor domain-containing protein, partial [Pseudobdellovibrio sp.]
MENNQNNSNSVGAFIDFFETSAILIDTKDYIVRCNDRLKIENSIFNFFDFEKDEKTYSLSQIDKEDWYKYLSLCFSTGASKFIVRSCFYECVMTRMLVDGEQYVLVNFFENKSLKEDVADFFLNDFRLSQLKELSEMAASIAHEINNPLTVISARTQLLKQSIKDNKVIPPEILAQNLEKIYLQ